MSSRASLPYTPTYSRQIQKEHNYSQQYSHIYLKRLLALRPALQAAMRAYTVVDKVIALRPGSAGVAVIGTLYKNQKLKPSVLDEFQSEFEGKEMHVKLDSYVSEDDSFILEDESGRVLLSGLEPAVIAKLVTGIVVGVVGSLMPTGALLVSEVVFAGKAPPARALKPCAGGMLVLASNLSCGSSSQGSLRLSALVDWIGQQQQVCRVVVVGGVVPSGDVPAERSAKMFEAIGEPVRVADALLAELASMVAVDVMPGATDPCNAALPQQPMHFCLFPNAARLSSFKSVPNPYSFTLGGIDALGHSGQAVQDALMYSRGLQPLDVIRESVLRWRTLVPTAPDTLPCYPFYDRDPFTLEASPHLYFVGGTKAFATSFDEQVRFVCVPDFAATGAVVCVNLASPELDTTTVHFELGEGLL
jgi:DNA polymerase delta subunit 2